jgi:hydrogenase/urease accessory protein HupE
VKSLGQFLLGLLACGWVTLAAAHPLAPALLQLSEAADGQVELLWRASVLQAVGVRPELPAGCRRESEPEVTRDERGAETTRWTLHCDGGLVGKRVFVPQLERAGINVILRIERADGSMQKTLLDAAHPAYTVPPPTAAPPVFPSYLQLGVEHLLFGFDHVLFVAGLVLLVRGTRRLLLTVTAFTLGHSLTLSLAVLGFVRVNPGLTELGIALSLLLLACDLARAKDPQRPPSWLARWPATMAVAFGLLHGLGFAGALAEIGLPPREIPLALFAFNLGIELGQLLLVGLLLVLGLLWRRLPPAPWAVPGVARLLPIYLIGTLAAYWCLERTAGLGG